MDMRGATFVVSLPVFQQSESEKAVNNKTDSDFILVVDDDPRCSSTLTVRLSVTVFEVASSSPVVMLLEQLMRRGCPI